MKSQVVNIHHRLHTLRHVDIDATVVNKNSGVDKIRLPLRLAAAQTRQQTVRLDQAHACLRQTNSIPHPVRKLPASKIRIVKDRVEACCAIVSRVAIALCPQKRALEAQIITVDRKLSSRH